MRHLVAIRATAALAAAAYGLLAADAARAMQEVDFDRHPDGLYDKLVKTDWKGTKWVGLQGRARIVSGAEAYKGKCLQMKYPAGSLGPRQGGGQFKVMLPPRDEYYCDYYVKFQTGFDFRRGGKLPGLCGGRGNTGGNKSTGDGWSARYMWRKGSNLILYLYHLDQKGKYGDNLKLGRACETGRWYRLTQRVKVNTPDQKDGILQVWVDGELVLDRSDIRYRNITGAQVDIFYFSTFHGGSNKTWSPRVDSYALFDNFRIHPTADRIFPKPRPKARRRTGKPSSSLLVVHQAPPKAPGPTADEVAAAKALVPALRQAVIDGVRGGRRENVYIDFGGRPQRGKVIAADEEAVTIASQGTELPIPWPKLSPRRFYGIAAKYTADHQRLAAYCRGMGLAKEAEAEDAAR